MSAHDHLTTDQIRTLDRAHVLHSWSTQSQIDPLVIAGGEGSRFRTSDGARYLDFASLVVNANLGHQHPRVTEAIVAQAHRLCATAPAMTDEMRVRLAALLAEVTPGDLTMSFFTNGGAEATENAIKLARWYTGRHKIVARYRSYHGATAGAVSVTGDPRRWAAEPGIPGVVRMFDPYPYRCPAGHPDPCPVCSGGPHLEEILQYEGPHTVAAVMLESVTGTNGVLVPPEGYLAAVREVCDRHGILLVLDEVSGTLSALEIENLVTVRDVCAVAQRAEMVRRIRREVDNYVIELGTEGRLLALQLNELVAGVDALRALGLSAAATLEEMATLLQQMALAQAVPAALDAQDPQTPEAVRLAAIMAPDCSTAAMIAAICSVWRRCGAGLGRRRHPNAPMGAAAWPESSARRNMENRRSKLYLVRALSGVIAWLHHSWIRLMVMWLSPRSSA